MNILPDPKIPSVSLITPRRFEDERGYFTEVWRADLFAAAGILDTFVQDNHSLSRVRGTIRGLHFQTGVNAQAKLVRCVRGRILDIAVDIRHGSPTYGQHAGYELSCENGHQLYIPIGFAHGFCTLEPDTQVTYKVSAYYDPSADHGLAFDDPDLSVKWPVKTHDAELSVKDRRHPPFASMPRWFPYLG